MRPGQRVRALLADPRAVLVRRGVWGQQGALALLMGLVVLVYLGTATIGSHPLPLAAQAVPIVLGNLLLELRALRRLLAVILAVVILTLLELGIQETRVGSVVVVALTAGIVYRTALTRSRLGLGGVRGDAVLADLRDRLAPGSVVPTLPAGWHAESAFRLAGGSAFGGDFLVTAESGGQVQVVLVDVSGSGLAAATRGLQLSGAFGALVGAVAPADFLAAANRYVLRQDWDDGFATAVHITVDTASGAYVLGSAGHPPAAFFLAGAGRWSLSGASGPALGLLAGAAYQAQKGVLGRGDAVLVYTDGLVEVAGRELEQGINRLLAVANTLVVSGFAGGAQRLLDGVPDKIGDDRAAVLLWRD